MWTLGLLERWMVGTINYSKVFVFSMWGSGGRVRFSIFVVP
jgi:hypothetical protein